MSLLMSALSCGITWDAAIRMPLRRMQMLVDARNDMYAKGDSSQPRVREATQGDIRKLFGR